MKLLFITGNVHKLKEATAILKGYEVIGTPLELVEIQSLDPVEIIRAKLAEAKKLVKERDAILLVEDVSFWIGETGLPGPLIKWFNRALGREGIVRFGKAFGAEAARAECNVGVLLPDESEPRFFTGSVRGRLVAQRGASAFGFDPIFVPDGCTKTFAEMNAEEKNAVSHRKRALEALAAHLARKY
jgi:inosine triphosphate pyrophosphatase